MSIKLSADCNCNRHLIYAYELANDAIISKTTKNTSTNKEKIPSIIPVVPLLLSYPSPDFFALMPFVIAIKAKMKPKPLVPNTSDNIPIKNAKSPELLPLLLG